jgi:hypothetical protein
MRCFYRWGRALSFGAICVLLSVAGSRQAAQAVLVPGGDFSGITFGPPSDIPGWSFLGHTPLIRPTDPADPFNAFGPLGDQVALLGTDDQFTQTDFNGVLPGDVETALNMPAGSIAGLGSLPTRGAVIWTTLTVAAGETLTFEYNHTSYDEFFFIVDPSFNDFSFIYLSAPGGGGVTILELLGDSNTLTSIPDGLGPTPAETGSDVFSSGPLAAGNYTLGLAIFNSNDNSRSSFLLVDTVELASVGAVPEASSWLAVGLAAIAVGVVCGVNRRRAMRRAAR